MEPVVWRPLLAACAVCIVLSPSPARAQQRVRRVSGSLVYWDQENGFRAIVAHADAFTEISPFWYHVDEDGQVRPYRMATGGSYEDPAILSFLRSHGILVIPTVANIQNGQWNGALVGRVLRDPALATTSVKSLVALAVDGHYDGIDIDYENLAAVDRELFSGFISSLATALHDHDKLLTVNVYGKTSEPGAWGGPMSQDWAVLGQAADEIRLMTYEFHWSTSEPGPIAPVTWVRDVLAFAHRVIPTGKIVHGLPFYGYDWAGKTGTPQVWDDAMAAARLHGASLQWDADSAAPWFEYTADGTRHTVWFENARSVESKLRLATASQAAGVMLWRLAGEDPAIWPAIQTFAAPSALTSYFLPPSPPSSP